MTRAVLPYAVIGEVPAKVLKYRFSEDVIAQLQTIQWWNWEPEKIFRMHTEFNSIDTFLRKAHEHGIVPM